MARILIVDDDEVMRTIVREHLSGTYEIIETGLPETALAMTLEHKPDAILLDLSMPGLSGFELCQALSSLSTAQKMPIFIVSAEDIRNKAFCLRLGASSYFTKPVDFARLKKELAQVLSSKKDERRADPRIQLRVILRLKGKSITGIPFEVRAETENMSKGGFLCSSASSLEEVTTVEVTLCGERDLHLGHARLVRIVKSETSDPQYGFQFIAAMEVSDLILQLKSGER